MHPSELPNFDKIPVYDATVVHRNRAPAIIVAGVAVLTISAMTLALRSTTPPTTGSLSAHIAKSVSDLPSYAQAAGASAIELVVTDNLGHASSTAAMVIEPGDLAVTTAAIPQDASLTGSSSTDHRFPVSLVSTDRLLGFTVVRLGDPQPVTPTSILPASSTVLAISPFFSIGALSPEIAYATTVLGDPNVEEAEGIVSYEVTQSASNLGGYADTLAVDSQGSVVAVLSAHDQWYSAAYITKVAQVITANGGCHGLLGIDAQSAQGGGVQVVKVKNGPSLGHLMVGDILEKANNVPLDSLNTLLAYLYASAKSEGVLFDLRRHGHNLNVGVVLGCQQ